MAFDLKGELKKILSEGASIYDVPSSLKLYSRDQGEVPGVLEHLLLKKAWPHLVVQPHTEADIVRTINFAHRKGLALIPRGAGTFGFGGAVPTQGGIVLDLAPLQEIEEINVEEGTITAKAGARWADLEKALQMGNLSLRTYPSSWFSTVGGGVATGGYGIGSTAFGHLQEQVVSLKVITPRGEVRQLRPQNLEFRYFFGTEGQMGVIWEITLKAREKPLGPFPFLLHFGSGGDEEALQFAAQSKKDSFKPYHMKYLDAGRMQQINKLLTELGHESPFKEQPSLLLNFDTPEEANAFSSYVPRFGLLQAPAYQAHYLWQERLFPLRIKRLGPGIMAAELILPLAKVPGFLKKAATEGRRFGVELTSEAHFLDKENALVLLTYTYTSLKGINQLFKAGLSLQLTYLGISLGGRPYGIGIWNTPLLKYRFGQAMKELQKFKVQVDPEGIFNPGKFFSAPARLYQAPPLKLGLKALKSAAPIQRWFEAKSLKTSLDLDVVKQAFRLCSRCGNCIPVCPAYLYTKDERTTARGKLMLFGEILNGKYSTEEAQVLFMCMHCHACTDVCQSNLELVPIWDELERRIAEKLGKDEEMIKRFVEAVEEGGFMEGRTTHAHG